MGKKETENFPKNSKEKNLKNGIKKSEPEIRGMEIDDLPLVFHLGEQIFTAREVPTLYRTWDEYEVISLFNSDNEYCLVAELDEKIVGFALGTTVSKKKSAWKYGYLVWLGILPEFQRKGVASSLFDKLAEKMIEDGVRIFLVDTEVNDIAALQFFKKKGFDNPQQHVYLTLNLKTHQQLKKRKNRAIVRNKKQKNEKNK